MGVMWRLRCMDTRAHVHGHTCTLYMDTHVWTHGAEPSCGPTRAWDRPSYGAAAKLGDGHLQTPHCRHWRQHTAVEIHCTAQRFG